ncbi:glycosyltransferase family 4 protein [Micromonospora thermarum]|uniref:Glycosyltransferase family 4 protein n=1 Tax=Micromonospora thermarum TaxID=2720024 RepID=A0ABX0YZ63_9ACTN|nr:glycosyltransferase family 4 protein [Micromonospora thermarum]NJP30805.1 glycosyltransferase family 4 protein [Micromonospora thermarum]
MHNDLSAYVGQAEFPALKAAVDSFAYCSRYLMQKAARDFGPHPGVVLYNCVDTSHSFRPAAGARHPKSLAFVGRLVPEKGVLEAIRVCQALNAADPEADWTLDTYGGAAPGVSSYETDYMRQVGALSAAVNREAGKDVVRLRGHVGHERLAESLARSTFFLYPCQWDEPFGMVLIEAMALGLIPVASRKGGIGEIVDHGVSGILIDEAGDEQRFASEILRLSGNPEALDALRRAALDRARRFSPENAAQDLRALLERLHVSAVTVGGSA